MNQTRYPLTQICAIILAAFFMTATAWGNEKNSEAALDATTTQGEKVRLLPNGRWEYVDTQKAALQREHVRKIEAATPSAQGGLFGLGRKIQPGDPDYNRGSLNPKQR